MDISWNFGLALLLLVYLVEADTKNRNVREQFAVEGSSYKIKCTEAVKNFDSPGPYIIWSVNSQPPRGPKYKVLSDGLVVRNVTTEDTRANYTCTALDRSSFTPVHAVNIKLKLRQRTGKLAEPKSLAGSEVSNNVKIWGTMNQWKTLHCSMFSRPSPTFKWINRQTNEEVGNVENLYKLVEDHSTSNLTIFIHDTSVYGEYTCKASNSLGESTQHFVLAKGYKPKSPFIFPTHIGRNKISIQVEAQEEDSAHKEVLPITNYFIQFVVANDLQTAGKSGNLIVDDNVYRKKWTTISNPATLSHGAQSPSARHDRGFELQNLNANTTYLVRAAVANPAAISEFSASIRVTTDSNTYTNNEAPAKENDREGYARSAKGSSTLSNHTSSECDHPKFKKTVTITTISSTVVEDIIDPGNPSVVKKRIEENTIVDRDFICGIN